MKHSRRNFLKSMGLLTAGTVAFSHMNPTQLKAAPNGVPRNFIFCYFGGGWDQLLCLDPRDPAKYTRNLVPQTGVELGYDLLGKTFSDNSTFHKNIIKRGNMEFGPTMASFAKHHDKCCILRGVKMDTVAHDVGRRYFITGEFPAGLAAKGSSWGTRIVAQQGELSDLPNLVIGVETYNQDHQDTSFATGIKATSARDLIDTLQNGPGALKEDVQKLLDQFRNQRNCDPTSLDENGLMDIVRTSQRRATALVKSQKGKYFDFLTKDKGALGDELQKIAGRYNITGMNTPEAQAALAFQSVKYGVAQTVTIQLVAGLDTHTSEWATDHPNTLHRGFKALSQLVTDLDSTPHPKLKGSSLLENTTIVCFSEFARTPKLNNKDGRDHHLVSSSLLIGAGVPHDTIIGASGTTATINGKQMIKGMTPNKIDPNTGAINNNTGTYINPQNILTSIMANAGYDHSDLRDHKPLPCLKA